MDAYTEHATATERSEELIKAISALLVIQEQKMAKDTNNWGLVGTMKKVAIDLEMIYKHLK